MDDRLGIREARTQLPAVLNAAAHDGHITIITREGEPAAAVIPLFMLAELEEWEDAIRLTLTLLGDDPYRRDGVDVKALTGRSGFRLRVGNYRLVYEVDDGKLVFLVITAGHHRDIYER